MLPLPLLIILRRDDDDDGDDSKFYLSSGAIAGIVVGVTVAVAVAIVVCWYNRHKLRRRKPKRRKRRNSDDEEKPLPVDRATTTPGSLYEAPTEMHTGDGERQMTELLTPAPACSTAAYSSIRNKNSPYNTHTAERGIELDGATKAINEIELSGKRSEHGLSESGAHGLELNSLEKTVNHGNSQSEQVLAQELSGDRMQSGDPTQRYSELESENCGSAEHGRLESDAISELPGSSVSGTTMMDANMTGETMSSMSTTR